MNSGGELYCTAYANVRHTTFTMSFENLIEQYGYWMVAAGTVIEGSTTVISSAFLAHRGYLNLEAVWGVATIATFFEGVTLYEIARGRGTALAHNADAKTERIQKVLDWVKRRGVALAGGVAISLRRADRSGARMRCLSHAARPVPGGESCGSCFVDKRRSGDRLFERTRVYAIGQRCEAARMDSVRVHRARCVCWSCFQKPRARPVGFGSGRGARLKAAFSYHQLRRVSASVKLLRPTCL